MKIILFIFTLLCNALVFSHNSITTIKITGSKERIAGFQLSNGQNKLLIKKLKIVNTIKQTIKEPIRVTLFNTKHIQGKQPEYVLFYLEMGKHEITVDIDKLVFASKTSTINQSYEYILKIKSYYDTLISNSNHHTYDSLNNAYHKSLYNYHIKQPNSFITLDFLDFISNNFTTVGITKEEVLKMYESLGKHLQQYPTYERVKKQIENFVYRYDSPYNNDSLPKPIFIIK